jgi:uncharacterized RDD family membrane protein YckC
MPNLYINTTQNIRLFFTTASVGERMLAFGIDLLIKSAYVIVVLFFLLAIVVDFFDHFDLPQVAFVFLLALPVIFYSLICESTMEGQTFGKKLMKIRVVKIDGYQASFLDYFIRWIFAIVDIQLGAIPGLVSMVCTKHTRRIGDLVAGTAVISEKSKYNLSHTILMDVADDYQPHFLRNQIMLFSDNDVRIIKENMLLAVKNKNELLIQRIAGKIVSLMQIDNPFSDNLQLIRIFLKDYNYYTAG